VLEAALDRKHLVGAIVEFDRDVDTAKRGDRAVILDVTQRGTTPRYSLLVELGGRSLVVPRHDVRLVSPDDATLVAAEAEVLGRDVKQV
jgi:hypothetical protein